MQSRSRVRLGNWRSGRHGAFHFWQIGRLAKVALIASLFLGSMATLCDAQPDGPSPQSQPPEAPQPALKPRGAQGLTRPCPVKNPSVAAGPVAASKPDAEAGPDVRSGATSQPGNLPCPPPSVNWYARFTNGPQVKPLTPPEKAWLALRNVVDPFNVITILGDSAIAVGSNAYSAYGPGMPGFARNVGVSFTQDMTGEFVNTFLIPSIVHQDPHYHRMPHASIPRRAGHVLLQVIWTQGDNGKGMPNYANLVGFAIDDEISNLYVPGRQTNLPASAERYATGLASAPIDNVVSEFLPDVASHIHVQIVVIQRIIDQVAKTGPGDIP